MSTKTILLVEDNRDDEALALRALKKNLLNNVAVVRDGAAALEYLLGESAPPLPAVVFLDLKLPKVDGLKVLKELKGNERTSRLPVVVLTSSDMEEDINEAYRFGCNSFIQKPVDFHKFINEIGQIGTYWALLNIAPDKIKEERA